MMAAGDPRLSLLSTVIADPQNLRFIYQQADGIINSIRWGAE
jgi:hypothetical protein